MKDRHCRKRDVALRMGFCSTVWLNVRIIAQLVKIAYRCRTPLSPPMPPHNGAQTMRQYVADLVFSHQRVTAHL
jgi:hypothetical protein